MLPIEPSPHEQSPPDESPIDSATDESSELPEGHILIVKDDRGQRRVVLEKDVYSIGRDPSCDIRLYSLFVSRHHATLVRIHQDDGKDFYRIVDGNLKGKPSSNGLLIKDKKFQSYELQNEVEVIFGPEVQAVYYRVYR